MPSKILITGADGFIGRALHQSFLKDGHFVELFEGDVTQVAAVTANLDKQDWDFVYHLAGISSPGECEANPSLAYSVNFIGTALIAETLAKKPSSTRLVFPSTAHVYAQSSSGTLTEQSALKGNSIYARTKLLAENLIERIGEARGLKYTIFRLFNHSHKSQTPNFALPSFYQQLLKAADGKSGPIAVGNIEVQRDFGTLTDLIAALQLPVRQQAEFDNSPSDTFNICSGQARKLSNLLKIMAKQLGAPADFEVNPKLIRQDDPEIVIGSPAKLAQVSGWKPQNLTDEEYVSAFLRDL